MVTLVKAARGDLKLKVKQIKTARTSSTPETRRRQVNVSSPSARRKQTGALPVPRASSPAGSTTQTPPPQEAEAAPTPAATPAATAAKSDDVPAALQQRIDQAVGQVESLAKTKFGIQLVGASGADYTARLQALVEQLEQAADGVAPLLPRLAQVTARLEASSGTSPSSSRVSGDIFAQLAAVVARIEQATAGASDPTPTTAAKTHTGPLSASGEEEDHPSVAAFDELLTNQLRTYLELSKQIGGDVAEQSELTLKAFIAMRRFLGVVPFSQKPGPKVYPQLLEAITKATNDTTMYADMHPDTTAENQLRAVSEGIMAMSWINVQPQPAPFVTDMASAGEFYSNRVIKEFKERLVVHSGQGSYKDDTCLNYAAVGRMAGIEHRVTCAHLFIATRPKLNGLDPGTRCSKP
eukprot:TRINITY_DN12155_c3_g3_i1.p1 TRINITY_DN12155_c3_g3~~TRINITY_DN12155_c3_g3_i1.p1  ORF type:complete len:474 (+),score=117.78 TRINITY_DN12155_c3_g3_i1:197-1423(+)